MSKQKIVLIGAGSLTFGLGTVGSIFESQTLNGATICLHDINEETLEVVTRTCKNALEERELNFTIESTPPTPEIISGAILDQTTPEMALSTDDESWIIESIEKFLEQRVELEFIFKNDTNIDFVNNTLDKVSIIINITAPDDLDSLNFELFDIPFHPTL